MKRMIAALTAAALPLTPGMADTEAVYAAVLRIAADASDQAFVFGDPAAWPSLGSLAKALQGR